MRTAFSCHVSCACSPYNGTMCADIIRPGIDHVLVSDRRADGNLTLLTLILENQWDLLSLATAPPCREAMRHFLCYYYYPVCRNATSIVPPKTVCFDSCLYVKNQLCPTEWDAIYNVTSTTSSTVLSDYNLQLSTCDSYRENYLYVPVPSCCIDVVSVPSKSWAAREACIIT